MPREIITIPVGQCGNQIAWRFWDLALREHAMHSTPGVYDEGMSTFFANVREAAEGEAPEPARVRRRGAPQVYGAHTALKRLKARAVLVDMEEGVVSQVLRSPIGDLFDRNQLITDVSGAGNNWAHGFCMYGPQYREDIMEQVRRALEAAESPQSFFLLHSMGGGTGSGVGTYILSQLADAYPELYRFTCAVFPSEDDDVITSPYNFTLAFEQLQEHADCILPLENQALLDVVTAVERGSSKKMGGASLRTTVSPVIVSSTLTYVPPAPLKASRLMFAAVDERDEGDAHGYAGGGASSAEHAGKSVRSAASSPALVSRSAPAAPLPSPRASLSAPVQREVEHAAAPTTSASTVEEPVAEEADLLASLQRAENALERAVHIAAHQPRLSTPTRGGAPSRTGVAAAATTRAVPTAAGLPTTSVRPPSARGVARVDASARRLGADADTLRRTRPAATMNGVAAAGSPSARSRSAAAGTRGGARAVAARIPAVGIIPGLVDPRDRRVALGRARAGAAPPLHATKPSDTGQAGSTAAPLKGVAAAATSSSTREAAAAVSRPLPTPAQPHRAGAGSIEGTFKGSERDSTAPHRSADALRESKLEEEERDGASHAPERAFPVAPPPRRSGTAFDAMNNVAAHLGALNVDLNEITTTMVPFPRLKLLQSSIAPLYALSDVATATSSRRIDSIFSEAFIKGHQLYRGDPRTCVHLACGLLLRGDVVLSDAVRNVERLKSELRMAHWNPDGFKLGICNARPVHQPYSLLALSNNTSVVPTLTAAHGRFMQLYRSRAHMHHYTQYMDFENIKAAGMALADVVSSYNEVEAEHDTR